MPILLFPLSMTNGPRVQDFLHPRSWLHVAALNTAVTVSSCEHARRRPFVSAPPHRLPGGERRHAATTPLRPPPCLSSLLHAHPCAADRPGHQQPSAPAPQDPTPAPRPTRPAPGPRAAPTAEARPRRVQTVLLCVIGSFNASVPLPPSLLPLLHEHH
jgi:hypothetical protein